MAREGGEDLKKLILLAKEVEEGGGAQGGEIGECVKLLQQREAE